MSKHRFTIPTDSSIEVVGGGNAISFSLVSTGTPGMPGADGALAPRVVQVALNASVALTTNAVAYFRIPAIMDNWVLTAVSAMCRTPSSSGIPTFTIKKGAVNMLSTNLTIDASETDSSTAATAAVIDTGQNGVTTGAQIEVACTVAGTGTTWAVVELTFQPQ